MTSPRFVTFVLCFVFVVCCFGHALQMARLSFCPLIFGVFLPRCALFRPICGAFALHKGEVFRPKLREHQEVLIALKRSRKVHVYDNSLD